MVKKQLRDKKIRKKIAEDRIKKLFYQAEKKALQGRQDLANRYVELARKISMRYLVSIPKEFRHKFCKHCHQYLIPPLNCRVRTYRGRIIIHCKNCGKYSRVPYK